MLSGMRLEYAAAIKPNSACGVKTKSSIQAAGALVLMLLLASAAQAQCTAVGPLA